MGAYIVRRLMQAVFTILGVMLITFVLFRLVAGDIAAARLGQKATAQQRKDFLHKFGYDKPRFINLAFGGSGATGPSDGGSRFGLGKVNPNEPWWDSQFTYYIWKTATFQARSMETNETLLQII